MIKLWQNQRIKAHGGRRIQTLLWTTLASVFLLGSQLLHAQYTPPYVGLTGTLGSANGMPASNYSITLVPTQVMYVGGSMVVVGNANCATDTNGAVIGTANPITPPILSATYVTGTVPAGNYYVEITWYDAFNHETLPSPEVPLQLTATGSIVVSPPAAGAPLSAVGMNIYIGTSSGAETYQGHVTNPASTYTQSAAVTTGAAVPNVNSTSCMVVANDAAWPIAGYMFNLFTPAGNNVPGYPQQVQFVGPGSAYNLSNGLPLFNGRVTYPVPVLTLPYNHNPQSISGPLSMTGYNVYNVGHLGVGTALPAWGVDVEGTGDAGAINANQGYLINGSGGTSGQAPCSDGTYVDQFCTFVTSLPTFYYQTVALNGTAQTQRSTLNFSSFFTATDSASPSRTTIDFPRTGSGSKSATSTAAGTSGHCAQWTSGGDVGDSGVPCPTQAPDHWQTLSGCTFPNDGGGLNCTAGTITWPVAYADTAYIVGCFAMYSSGIAGGSSTQPVIIFNATNTDTSHTSITEGVAQGSAGGYLVSSSYGLTIVCEAHHN